MKKYVFGFSHPASVDLVFNKMASQKPDHRNYTKELREAGVRITRAREIILDLLSRTNDHPGAAEIFRHASLIDSSVSLSTVYRTMKLLEETGAIRRHAFEGGPSRFEPAGEKHHDHLIDVETGQVIEFSSCLIEDIQKEIALSLGYEIVHHRLELYGRKKSSTPKLKNK